MKSQLKFQLLIFFSLLVVLSVSFQNCSQKESSQDETADRDSDRLLSISEVDGDGDGFCKAEFLNHEYCLKGQEADCNDSDPMLTSLTTYFADQDGDGYGSNLGEAFCLVKPPAGFAKDNSDPDDKKSSAVPSDLDGDLVSNASDCAPTDASRWRKHLYHSKDLDHDGHWRLNEYQSGSIQEYVCAGDSRPAAYSTNTYFHFGKTADCDDSDATITNLTVFTDKDGDGLGSITAYACRDQSGELVSLDNKNYPSSILVENSNDCNDSDLQIKDIGEQSRNRYSITEGSEANCNAHSMTETRTCTNGIWSGYSGADTSIYLYHRCKVILIKKSCSASAPSQMYVGVPPKHAPTCTASCPSEMHILNIYSDGGTCTNDLSGYERILGTAGYDIRPLGSEHQELVWKKVTCEITCTPN